MDDELQNDGDDRSPFTSAREIVAQHHEAATLDPEELAEEREALSQVDEHDLLDEPVLPLFGLSAGTIAAIFVGGALGTLSRYLLEVHHPMAPGAFPWVTLLVNLSGSFAIGLLLPLTEHVSHRAHAARPLLIVGFLGGWTTYSTLAVDATLLAKDGHIGTCLAYLAATVIGGLALVIAGHDLGRRLAAS
ncbi:MAG TPA: CrcB family protein [Acidimicrobiales bacterium]|nr:CrcB family protein [Acidimicrobiales bacterium]